MAVIKSVYSNYAIDLVIVNSGYWVTDNDFHNIYVKIDDIGGTSNAV